MLRRPAVQGLTLNTPYRWRFAIFAPVPKVFLIGFMCSGKSTVGRALAPLLGMPFVDLDRVVEQRVGPLLPYIQKHGEAAFREQEAAVLQELLRGADAVVGTGGGTPCQQDHLERMKQAGTVVWLDVSWEPLIARIERSGGDRPLLFGLKGEALHQRVRDLLAERLAYYHAAHVRIPADEAAATVAARIAERLTDQPK